MKKKELIDYILNSHGSFNGNVFTPMLDSYVNTIKDFYKNFEKLEDYLYYVKYKDINYEAGKEYFKKYHGRAACSVCRKGNIIGRNYDWYYDNQVSFVVETEKTNSHFWSIGMTGGIAELDKEFVAKKDWQEIYNMLPTRMLDGVNENGVFCEVNVVPNGDLGKTTGTKPGAESLCTKEIVRFVLDNATSAADAIEKLSKKNIWAPNSKEANDEFHFMIADKVDTFVIEFINNEMVVVEGYDAMTNFYLFGFGGTKASLTPNGAGWERYNILEDGLEDVEDEDDMMNLMKSVWYSNAYQEIANEDYPVWYSEFNGDYTAYGLGILNNSSPEENFNPVISYVQNLWEIKTRDIPTVWHTVHTSVYDIENKTLTVVCQEGNTEYSYSKED